MPIPCKKSKTDKFSLCVVLSGHHGAVECLAVSEDGKLLASGGADGTRVWDIQNSTELLRPSAAGSRGATSRLLWHFEEMYCDPIVNPAEITGLDFDPTSSRLIVCHRKTVVQSYTLDRSSKLQPIFSVGIEGFVPKGVAFGDYKNTDREIMVFGLDDGRIHTLQGTDGAIVKTRGVGGKIGNAIVNSRKGLLCFDDPSQGAALYRLDDEHRVITFSVKMAKADLKPRQVCFANDGGFVVSGSDHGIVYVFDRWTGEIMDELGVAEGDWVQIVTISRGESTIIAARSGELSGPNDILVWKFTGNKRRLALPGFWAILTTLAVSITIKSLPTYQLRLVVFIIFQGLACPSRTYECALRLEGHRVPVAQRNSHEQASAELSLAAVKEQVDDARNSLVNAASAAEDTAHVNVRWPEMLRLPYWNSNQMLVIDPMQFVSEGAVDYHCHLS
ncbi:hypothetical protein MVEN_00694900 [Mycena venus]|uniref:WD40 repeat-like protein n=1 Tax=Mycena venus TaxID=2733690 RepID=A0A8H6YK15_9AGAR|nr:hypothetical protein MVEN_00694900 [Mycena venus]